MKILLVAKRLQRMKKQQGSIQRELQEYLNSRIDTAARDLSCYLKSPKVQEELTSWTSDDVPVHEDSWGVTDNAKKTPKAAQLRDTNLGRIKSCCCRHSYFSGQALSTKIQCNGASASNHRERSHSRL